MNPRELIILVLGLAIVAVVLRGLFLALRARRGQIKLAIDKNIPQDIDLEALELAELPGGGARVVARQSGPDSEQASRLSEAQERAAVLNLGRTEPNEPVIPVLMDAVEVRSEAVQATASNQRIEILDAPNEEEDQEEREVNVEPVFAADSKTDAVAGAKFGANESDSAVISEADADEQVSQADESEQQEREDELLDPETDFDDYGKVEPALSVAIDDQHQNISPLAADPENNDADDLHDVLLDYGVDEEEETPEEHDSMAAIAPDYESDDLEPEMSEPEPNQPDSVKEQDSAEHQRETNRIENPVAEEADVEAALTGQSFEQQLEDFSMSAGERIGYNDSDKPKQPIFAAQPTPKTAAELNDTPTTAPRNLASSDGGAPTEAETAKFKDEERTEAKSSGSFFSMFKRKPKEPAAESPAPQAPEPAREPSRSDKSIPQQAPDTKYEPADLPKEDAKSVTAELPFDELPEEEGEQVATPPEDPNLEQAVTEPSEVLVVNVMAREGYEFAGDDLLQVLITSGLKFGEMNIFHHHVQGNAKGPILFSVANVLNPGTFDLNNMSEFSTLGISFFLALPTSMKNMESFELMLAVAQQVKGGLDGELRDDHRNLMTAQTIEHYRQRVRDFELRQLKAGIRSN